MLDVGATYCALVTAAQPVDRVSVTTDALRLSRLAILSGPLSRATEADRRGDRRLVDNGPGPAGPPPGWEGLQGPGPQPRLLARTLRGRSVTSDGKGGFVIELTQTGAVIATTDGTLAVRGDDGYTQTYALDADTRTPQPPL